MAFMIPRNLTLLESLSQAVGLATPGFQQGQQLLAERRQAEAARAGLQGQGFNVPAGLSPQLLENLFLQTSDPFGLKQTQADRLGVFQGAPGTQLLGLGGEPIGSQVPFAPQRQVAQRAPTAFESTQNEINRISVIPKDQRTSVEQSRLDQLLGRKPEKPITSFKVVKKLVDDPSSPTKFSVEQFDQAGKFIGKRTATPKEVKEGVVADPQTGLSAKDISNLSLSQGAAFRGDIRVKNIRIIETFSANVESVYQKSLTSKNLGPIDIALAKAFQKLTDLGSSVREGEFLTTFQGSPLINKIKGKFQAVLKGGLGFTLEERKAIRDVTKLLQNDSRIFFNEALSEFTTTADELGLNKRAIFGGREPFPITETPSGQPLTLEQIDTELKRRGSL